MWQGEREKEVGEMQLRLQGVLFGLRKIITVLVTVGFPGEGADNAVLPS